MPKPQPLGAEESFRNGCHYFLQALEILSHEPERQCKEMGDYNTAWELKDDVMAGRYLLGQGFLLAAEEAAIARLLKALEAVDVRGMPGGDGREPNLKAMANASWAPVRALAKTVLWQLRSVDEANRAYFARGGGAT